MLKTDEVVVVLGVLGSLVNRSKLFTAYDVTRLARSELQEHLEHNDVKGLVHLMYESHVSPFGGLATPYIRSYGVDMGNGTYADVYGPDGVDAYSLYDKDHNKPMDLTNKRNDEETDEELDSLLYGDDDDEDEDDLLDDDDDLEEDDDDVVPAKSSSNDFVRVADVSGRISVRKELLEKLGLKPGKKVFVAHRNNGQKGLVLLAKAPGSGLVTTLHVDSRGSVRLAPSTLKAASIKDSAKISGSASGAIVVMPA